MKEPHKLHVALLSSDRDVDTKMEFALYLEEHPEERFWQSVRNFSDAAFILTADYPTKVEDSMETWVNQQDTFYREGK